MSAPTGSAAAATTAANARAATPIFWAQPFRYMRYASHVYPARFYSIVIGGVAPLFLFAIPLRKKYGYGDDPQVPRTYPIPNRKREPVPTIYDD